MCKSDFLEMVRDHAANHPNVFNMVARTISYVCGLMAVFSISAQVYNDTYSANIGLFILFSVAFELLWNGGFQKLWSVRYMCYLFCVMSIVMFGGVLLKQGMAVQGGLTATQNSVSANHAP